MPLSFAEIKERFEQEQRTRRPPVGIDDLPFTYDDITPEWLTAVLARGHPAARVLSLELGPVDNGTSNRRRIAVEWNEAGREAQLVERLFCKGTQSLESRYMLGMNEGVQAEVNFYNLVRPRVALRAPVALFARYDPLTLNSIIMMRDMQGEVNFCQLGTELELHHAQSQMRLFAILHSRYYGSKELESLLAPFSLWEDFFTITCDDAGFTDACLRGFRMAEAVIPARLFRREAEVWPATLRCAALHRTMPRGLNHSDVHLKNWYIEADGEMGINDWQNCAKGNGARDLAYCIATSLPIDKRRRWERELIAYYCEEFRRAGGPVLDQETVFLRYRQQMFAALAWWTGTLVSRRTHRRCSRPTPRWNSSAAWRRRWTISTASTAYSRDRHLLRCVQPEWIFGMISSTSRFMSSSVFATGTPENGGHSSGMSRPASRKRLRLSVICAAVPTSRLLSLPLDV